MAFMAVEVCICQGPIYVMDGILVMKASSCQYILFCIFLSRFQLLALILLLWSLYQNIGRIDMEALWSLTR